MNTGFSKRKATTSGLPAVLVVAVAVLAAARHDSGSVSAQVLAAQVVQANGNSQGNGATNGNGSDPKGSFNITGQAQGLYPGAVIALPLTLSNPQSFGIRVTQLTVAVQAPGSAAGCTAGAVEVGVIANGQFTARNPIPVSVTLGKNGTASLPSTVQLHMVASPPDACQGATFALSYSGSAVKS